MNRSYMTYTGKNYGLSNQRHSLCSSWADQATGVCRDRGDHFGARDWCEYGDLQPREYGVAAFAPGRSSRRNRFRCGAWEERFDVGLLVSELQGLSRSQ